MTTGLALLTWALFVLPTALLYATVFLARGPERWILGGATAFVAIVYASVWLLWRPTRFEVDTRGLRIVWPLRSRLIERGAIVDARVVTASEFRREFGYGARVGAGGLGGGFGLLRTRRQTFSMWISRLDRFVIVRVRDARPLLLTPETPEGFVAALRSR
jgi:hypothetical protein